MNDLSIYTVDPARLAPGEWSADKKKRSGQGDILASYSADLIASGKPLRRPFLWCDARWVNVGSRSYRGTFLVEAYLMIPVGQFQGDPVTYQEKTADEQAARADECGFYHGILVRHGGHSYVLVGPPIAFRPAPAVEQQLELFGPTL